MEQLQQLQQQQEMFSSQYKMWTREATTVLIQQYQINECMWMTTSPFYRNKQKRTEALINIAATVSTLRPQTTAEDIKNKINGIRTQYVSEINKLILASNREEPYEPTLWCFDLLTFLKPFTQPKHKSLNGNWTRICVPKPSHPQFATPSRPQLLEVQQPAEKSKPKSCIVIKEESDDNDVEIIEEEDTLQTDDDYSSHSSYYPEDKHSLDQEEANSSFKEATPPRVNSDSGFEDNEGEKVKQFFPPPGISAEITLVPKKAKRKIEEITFTEAKKRKEAETNTENKDYENETRTTIFGKFVMSQMKIITDKVLLLKLEHTIQNAIIEAQLKQIEKDEADKKANDPNN